MKSRQIRYVSRLEAEESEGRKGFWPKEIFTSRTVGTPKIDSHLLGLVARSYARGAALDLFTGSGVVAAWYGDIVESVHCTDLNPAAINEAEARLSQMQGVYSFELVDGLPETIKPYDLITANPPYSGDHTSNFSEMVCNDPGHRSLIETVSKLHKYLSTTGKALISWADYESFDFLEGILEENRNLDFEVISSIRDPATPSSEEYFEYRIYMLTRSLEGMHL